MIDVTPGTTFLFGLTCGLVGLGLGLLGGVALLLPAALRGRRMGGYQPEHGVAHPGQPPNVGSSIVPEFPTFSKGAETKPRRRTGGK